jgi:hypothetical protein
MIVYLKSIAYEGTDSFRIVLEEANRTVRTFILNVEEGDIQCVTWQSDFAEYMNQNLGPASSLFEAVLAFHRARCPCVPDP